MITHIALDLTTGCVYLKFSDGENRAIRPGAGELGYTNVDASEVHELPSDFGMKMLWER